MKALLPIAIALSIAGRLIAAGKMVDGPNADLNDDYHMGTFPPQPRQTRLIDRYVVSRW